MRRVTASVHHHSRHVVSPSPTLPILTPPVTCRSIVTSAPSSQQSPLPPHPPAVRRRVVVTGMGAVTPLGCGVRPVWASLVAGHSGLGRLSDVLDDAEDMPSQVVAAVPTSSPSAGVTPFVLQDWVTRQHARTQSVPFIAYALAAASEALDHSGVLDVAGLDRDRVGVAIGSGIGCIQDTSDTAVALADPAKGYRRGVSPYFVPRILVNMAAGHVSMQHGLKGPNHAVSTACTTGAHAIGDAYRFIQRGDADVMVAGGTEASINRITLSGFCKLRALSTGYNDDPAAASRPFDDGRDGFVLGEGAGCVVLEEYDHAVARGAPILAEVRGYGLSGDAFHVTAPSETGDGAVRAMRAALRDGGVPSEVVGHVNAHATSTPTGDDIELRAIQQVFGGGGVRVSSTKGATGHLLGAAGAVEAIFAVQSIATKTVPPTLNLGEGGDVGGVELVGGGSAMPAPDLVATVSNSFGFGGTNASLLFTDVDA